MRLSVIFNALLVGLELMLASTPARGNQPANAQAQLDSLARVRSGFLARGDRKKAAEFAFENYRLIRRLDRDSATRWAEQALVWADQLNDPHLIAYGDAVEGVVDFLAYRDSAALAHYRRSAAALESGPLSYRLMLYQNIVEWARVNNDVPLWYEYGVRAVRVADSLGNNYERTGRRRDLSILYQQVGQYARAIQLDLESLAIQDTTQNSDVLFSSYESLAITYSQLGDMDRAIEAYTKIFRRLDLRSPGSTFEDSLRVAGNLLNIGIQYKKSKRYAQALACYDSALALTRGVKAKDPNNVGFLADVFATAYNNLGSLAQVQGRFAQAEEFFRKSIAYGIDGKLAYVIDQSGYDLTTLYVEMGQMARALKEGGPVYARALRNQDLRMIERLGATLAEASAALGRHRDAYQYLQQQRAAIDSLDKSEQIRSIGLLELETAINSREQRIAQLSQARKIDELWRMGLVGGLFLTVVAGGGIYFGYRQTQKKNQLLNETNREIAAKNAEIMAQADELRATQDQLIKAERMAALGKLTSHVAHEINTPLAAIRSSAQLLDAQLAELLSTLTADLRSLSADEIKSLSSLTQFVLQREGIEISTREERTRRTALTNALIATPWADQREELAQMAVEVGLERADQLTPYLSHERLPTLLRLAVALTRNRSGLQTIVSATSRTSRIVTHLRTLSRQRAENRLEAISLKATLTSATQLYRRQLDSGFAYREQIAENIRVPGNGELLTQVWSNLLLNAIQASNPGAQITLEADARDGWAEVRISNAGAGISPGDTERVFEPFYSTRAEGEGSGLGLYVAREIVTEHGGTISLTSENGLTTATVRLPLTPA